MNSWARALEYPGINNELRMLGSKINDECDIPKPLMIVGRNPLTEPRVRLMQAYLTGVRLVELFG